MPNKTPGEIAIEPDDEKNHCQVEHQNHPLKSKDRAKVDGQKAHDELIALQPDKPDLLVQVAGYLVSHGATSTNQGC
ncbi:hypothetical protein DESC_920037 [Desulfosarcina cetonica]|nr:hypothetical protein DESC_920037 [Desulfosarcina cetonica]